MSIWFIFWLINLLFLVGVSAIRPIRARSSQYELERIKLQGLSEAELELKRENSASIILSIKYLLIAFSIFSLSLISILCFGWLVGILIMMAIIFCYSFFSRLKIVQKIIHLIYKKYEVSLLNLISRHKAFFKFFTQFKKADINSNNNIGSAEEFIHLIEEKTSVLTQNEKKMLIAGLEFESKRVGDIMTPRIKIIFVDKTEFLGPLALDELHKKGHGKLPVVDKELDSVVGILSLVELLSLDKQNSMKASSAMSSRVIFINHEASLSEALNEIVKSNQNMLIVIDEYGKTIGLITLSDILEAIFGRKISSVK